MRRFLLFLAVVVLVLGGLGAGLVWQAAPLAQRVALYWLADHGVAPLHLRVERLDFERLVLSDVVLGDGVAVGRLELSYDLGDRSLGALEIDGLTLRAKWRNNGTLHLPGLPDSLVQSVMGERSEAEEEPEAVRLLPRSVAVRGLDVALAAPQGYLTLTGAVALGTLVDLTAPALTSALTATLELYDWVLPEDQGRVTGHLTLGAETDGSDRRLSLRLLENGVVTVTDHSLSLPWPAPTLTVFLRQGLSVEVSGEGEEGHSPAMPLTLAVVGGGVVEAGAVTGTLDLGGRLRASLNGTLHGAEVDHLTVDVGSLPLTLPGAEQPSTLAGRLILEAGEILPHASRAGVSLRLDLSDIAVPDLVTAPAARVDVDGVVTLDGGVIRLFLEDSTIALGSPARLSTLTLPEGGAWTLDSLDPLTPALEVALEAGGGLTLIPALRLPAPRLEARLGTPPRPVRLSFQAATVEGLWAIPASPANRLILTLDKGQALTDPARLEAVTARLSLDGDDGDVDFSLSATMATLPGEDTSPQAPRPGNRPFRLSGEGEIRGEALSFTARLEDNGGRSIFTAEGTHDLNGGRGAAQVETPDLLFTDAFQPWTLHNTLAPHVQQVDGSMAARGVVSWTPNSFTPDLDILLQDLTFSTQGIRLHRVNGVVRLTSFDPPRTPPGQTVAVGLIDAGLPLTGALATFTLDGAGALLLEEASLSLAGGTVTSGPARFPLDLSSGGLDLAVTNLQLAQLARLANLEGLEAEGTLTGLLPLRLRDNTVWIDFATLSATAPGVLRYRPVNTNLDALAAGMALALQALDNFHFSALALTSYGDAMGELETTLHLAGNNPDLYGGYPIELNLSLSGEVSALIRQGLTSTRVPDIVRHHMEEFHGRP